MIAFMDMCLRHSGLQYTHPGTRWSLDFVADTLVSGRRFRILTLVDDFTRECLALVVDTSLTGLRVARELDRIAELRSYPHTQLD